MPAFPNSPTPLTSALKKHTTALKSTQPAGAVSNRQNLESKSDSGAHIRAAEVDIDLRASTVDDFDASRIT